MFIEHEMVSAARIIEYMPGNEEINFSFSNIILQKTMVYTALEDG